MSADRLITDPEFRRRQRERYEYLKTLRPAERMFWNSAWPGFRGTYNVGRNAEKRAKRERSRLLSMTWRQRK